MEECDVAGFHLFSGEVVGDIDVLRSIVDLRIMGNIVGCLVVTEGS